MGKGRREADLYGAMAVATDLVEIGAELGDAGPATHRVAWRDTQTGKTGCGEPIPEVEANRIVAMMNASMPWIEHWAEPAPEPEETPSGPRF